MIKEEGGREGCYFTNVVSKYFQIFIASIKMFEVFDVQPKDNVLNDIISDTIIDKL